LLLAELNTVHVARMDQMEQTDRIMNRINWGQIEQAKRRLALLEILADYDYR
jgi:hypothetical protein